MASQLESRIEAIDAVVNDFSSALKRFVDDTSKNVRLVDNNVSSLGDCWSGSLYTSFKDKMLTQTATINASLKRGDTLQKKLEEISNEFANALKLLRASGKSDN